VISDAISDPRAVMV
jgi:hypothetical protein